MGEACAGRKQRKQTATDREVEIDLLTHSVRRGGRRLELQPREFQLLEFLARNVGQVLDRPTLLAKVWDWHFDPRTNVVESHSVACAPRSTAALTSA